MTEEQITTWKEAASIDEGLRMRSADWSRLDAIRIRPKRFALNTLHRKMFASEPVIFTDCPIALKGEDRSDAALIKLIEHGFPVNDRARVKTGIEARMRYMSIPHVMKRWQSSRAIMNVSDLHFRGTPFEKGIDASVLTHGNILRAGSEDMAAQEMFTLVISTKGAMSDSHSDDPDGSNHCFIGKKLWLAWETFEGRSKGLEDVSRDTCEASAQFSMKQFLSLKSACWFTVSRGQTLFLPGRLTHKVITLENYIGLGCFYVTLPNCVGSVVRWEKYGPLWALNSKQNDHILEEIARVAAKKARKISQASISTRTQWGFDYFRRAIVKLSKHGTPNDRDGLLSKSSVSKLLALD
jgi:hypothetical protein